MLSQVTSARFFPRRAQETASQRRYAALRAEVGDVCDCLDKLEREQRLQFDRMAHIQMDIDEIKALLKKMRMVNR